MIVRVEFKNKNLEVVAVEDIELPVYCSKLASDLTSILSDIESLLYRWGDANNLNVDQAFYALRHRLFDVSGSISRLPQNLMLERKDIT